MGVTYEVSYWEEEKERYDVSFADEGLENDVAETVGAITHTQSNIESRKTSQAAVWRCSLATSATH